MYTFAPQRVRARQRFLLMVLLSVISLVGCASSATPTATPAPTATTLAAQPTQLKVAMISPNRIFDKGYLELAWTGVQSAEKALNAKVKPVEVLDHSLVMKNVDELVSQGFNVIVLVSPELRDSAIEAAKKYPQVMFIGVDHFQDEALPNLVGLIFREDQAGYLAGALAALMSKTGKVGAVLGTDEIPQLRAFGEGFRQGALSQKPTIDVTLVYHNEVRIEKSFVDPEWGRVQAEAMMDDGIDIIFTAAGATGSGALQAIAERQDTGVLGIGVDNDQYFTLPETQPILLSSSMKQVDVGILDILKQIQAGSATGGNFYGTIGLAPYHDLESQVPDTVKQKMITLQEQLEQGQITIDLATPTPR